MRGTLRSPTSAAGASLSTRWMYVSTGKRPRLTETDRSFWAWLSATASLAGRQYPEVCDFIRTMSRGTHCGRLQPNPIQPDVVMANDNVPAETIETEKAKRLD